MSFELILGPAAGKMPPKPYPPKPSVPDVPKPKKEVVHEKHHQPSPSLNAATGPASSGKNGGLLIPVLPEALRLIRIRDRNMPDFCEICGRSNDLFSNGFYVSCIDCYKDAKLLRKAGVHIPERPRTPQEFLTWLATTHNNVMEVL